MKKLIIINSLLLLMVVLMFVFGYYLLNYPETFNYNQVVKDAEWKAFFLIILGIFAFSIVLGLLPIKRYGFKNTFFATLALLNSLFLIFLIFKGINSFLENKKYFDETITYYKSLAEKDIKNNLIIFRYAGGYRMPPDEKEQKMNNEIDSLTKTYGLIYQNSGCIISASILKAQEKYRTFTKSYLDKRNGAGWEERMQKQIQQVLKSYHLDFAIGRLNK